MAVPFLKEKTPLQTGNGTLVGLGGSNKPINEGAGLKDGDSDMLGVMIVVLFKTASRATFPPTTMPEETDAATAAVAATAMPICTLAVAAAPAAAPAAAAEAPAAAAAPAVALAAADAAAPALAAA